MRFERSAGVLLHPASLPGRFGIGDLGTPAHDWLDFLARSRQSVWQVLPLGPTEQGNSPYSSPSAFAGNPDLISLDKLVAQGLLDVADLADAPAFDSDRVQYDQVVPFKRKMLRRSFEIFEQRTADRDLMRRFSEFCARHRVWLDDYSLYQACKEDNNGASWMQWPREIRMREAGALAAATAGLAREISRHRFYQWLFFEQWLDVVRAARARRITIIGDVPIFVAPDSADVWANQELFHLDPEGHPTVVAGVPPDYFSATGQRWGNPLYRWDVMKGRGYDWWIRRLRSNLEFFDVVRLDHFRGFESFWEIPATEPDAVRGRWVQGPGEDFFDVLKAALGRLPFYAEDLGIITPAVETLRDRYEMAGTKVLQFAFAGDPQDPHLPHNFCRNCVVFTGTHDNDTSIGWYANAPETERDRVRRYLACDGSDIAWDLMRCAYRSVADLVIVPLQDLLRLGSEARMNIPGAAEGNWCWRYRQEQLDGYLAGALAEMSWMYGRARE